MSSSITISKEYTRLLKRDWQRTRDLLASCDHTAVDEDAYNSYRCYLQALNRHYYRLDQLVWTLSRVNQAMVSYKGYAHDLSSYLYHNGCIIWLKGHWGEIDEQLSPSDQWDIAYEGLTSLAQTLASYTGVRLPLLEDASIARDRAHVLLCYLWRWHHEYGQRYYQMMMRERPRSITEVENLSDWLFCICNDESKNE